MNMLKLTLFAVIFASAPLCWAQENSGISLQVAILKQAFRYEKSLTEKDTIRVGVICVNKNSETSARILQEFQSDGDVVYQSVCIEERMLTRDIEKVDVVFFMPETNVKLAHVVSSEKGILSSTLTETFVKNGQAGIAVILNEGKPQLLVSRRALKKERRELRSEILALAKQLE
jgi:YfiR/HmsC-like